MRALAIALMLAACSAQAPRTKECAAPSIAIDCAPPVLHSRPPRPPRTIGEIAAWADATARTDLENQRRLRECRARIARAERLDLNHQAH